jgi:hypothetical protein
METWRDGGGIIGQPMERLQTVGSVSTEGVPDLAC